MNKNEAERLAPKVGDKIRGTCDEGPYEVVRIEEAYPERTSRHTKYYVREGGFFWDCDIAEILTAEQPEPEEQDLPKCRVCCHDCKTPYANLGIDLVLPDQQWKAICPEGGILCANCICKRAEKFKATALLGWLDNLDYGEAKAIEAARKAGE